MKTKKLGPRITVSLDAGTYQELNRIAEAHRVSVSWLARHAIDDLLAQCRSGKKIQLVTDKTG
jgi:predicted transcriptional regulator